MGGDGGKQIPSDRHHALKESSLLLHDVQTGGIPGLLLPCAEMPVKFTDNLCREEKIFKHTMGRLKEIVLSAAMAEQVQQAMPSAPVQAYAPEARDPASGHEERNESEVILPGLPEGNVMQMPKDMRIHIGTSPSRKRETATGRH